MIKRLFALLLALLMLTGCGSPGGPPSTSQETEPTTEAPPSQTDSTYPPARLEAVPQDAITAYQAGMAEQIFPLGENLVLTRSGEQGLLLELLAWDDFRSLGVYAAEGFPQQIFSTGDTLYLLKGTALQQLDDALRPIREITLPENALCILPAGNGESVYYTLGSSVYAQSTSDGLSRLVREYPAGTDLTLESTLQNDRILQVFYDSGNGYRTEFLSAGDGVSLSTLPDSVSCYGNREDGFFTLWDDVHNYYYYDGASTLSFTPQRGEVFLTYLPELHSAIFYLYDFEAQLLTLRDYDMGRGVCTSEVTVSGVDLPMDCVNMGAGNVYMTFYDSQTDGITLVRWDLSLSETGAVGISRLGPVYTPENPDTQGLARCADTARGLSEKLGITILTGQAAVEVQPWDYTLTEETRVPQIEEALEILEEQLSAFPESFFPLLTDSYDSVNICIVRSITGNPESGSIESADGLQFWEENTGYIALVATGQIQQNIFHELSHLMDSYILGNCNAYDSWESLNPEGFQYDLDYIQNLERTDYNLTEGDSRAFIDTYSMSFPTEDRARILEYAATPDNAYCFQSATMQRKLKTVCSAIRTAFRLTKYPESFLWEQYLDVPLAYTGN